MDFKEAITKIGALITKFNVVPEEIVTTEQKFTDAKLQTGEIIQYDAPELAQGVIVNVVTPDGILPIPDGEYLLEDGSKLVTSGGLVAEYVPAAETEDAVAPEAEATPAAGAMETKAAPKRVIKSQVEEHVFSIELEDYEVIKVDLSSMFKTLVDENKALKEVNKEIFALVTEISGEPAVTATEKERKPFNVKEFKANFKADLLKQK